MADDEDHRSRRRAERSRQTQASSSAWRTTLTCWAAQAPMPRRKVTCTSLRGARPSRVASYASPFSLSPRRFLSFLALFIAETRSVHSSMYPYQHGQPSSSSVSATGPARRAISEGQPHAHAQHLQHPMYMYEAYPGAPVPVSSMQRTHLHHIHNPQQLPPPASEPIRTPAFSTILMDIRYTMQAVERNVLNQLNEIDTTHRERQSLLDNKLQEVQKSVVDAQKPLQHDIERIASYLETAQAREVKALGRIFERVARIEETVGTTASSIGPSSSNDLPQEKTLAQRMDNIECLLFELLEKAGDPDASSEFSPTTSLCCF